MIQVQSKTKCLCAKCSSRAKCSSWTENLAINKRTLKISCRSIQVINFKMNNDTESMRSGPEGLRISIWMLKKWPWRTVQPSSSVAWSCAAVWLFSALSFSTSLSSTTSNPTFLISPTITFLSWQNHLKPFSYHSKTLSNISLKTNSWLESSITPEYLSSTGNTESRQSKVWEWTRSVFTSFGTTMRFRRAYLILKHKTKILLFSWNWLRNLTWMCCWDLGHMFALSGISVDYPQGFWTLKEWKYVRTIRCLLLKQKYISHNWAKS